MRHSQKHRGRTIVVHAQRERGQGYAWTYRVEELPTIAGRGITREDQDARESALCQAMCAARSAIDQAERTTGAAPDTLLRTTRDVLAVEQRLERAPRRPTEGAMP